jgi:decaprenyl-phosphate phosphoribosyltransferase
LGVIVDTDASERLAQPRGIAGDLLRTARPKQWTKNLLVFAAPLAAGLTAASRISNAVIAFVCFCFASSGTYFLNDVFDRESDRLHPRKQMRPIASGRVSPGVASAIGILLLAAAIVGAFSVNLPLATAILVYVALTTGYTVWIQRLRVVELVAVAAGFITRAIAGGLAVNVPFSRWFVIVVSFGSLFMIAGKRHADQALDVGLASHLAHRSVSYPIEYLSHVRWTAAAVTLAAYCLWAFEKASESTASVWFQLSIVPFVLAIMRYGLLVEEGRGGVPEDVIVDDRPLQVIGLVWILIFGIGVYAS